MNKKFNEIDNQIDKLMLQNKDLDERVELLEDKFGCYECDFKPLIKGKNEVICTNCGSHFVNIH